MSNPLQDIPVQDISVQDILIALYGPLKEVAEETISRLGKKRTGLFVDLYNDALDLLAIDDAYPKEELATSLIYHDLLGLLKELHWLHGLFLCGNYPVVYRNLRFVWELIFRAYHADTYADVNPNDPDQPGPTAAEKNAWLAIREDCNRLNWNTVIRPTLDVILPAAEHALVGGHYHALWHSLNACVHPSADLRLRRIGKSMLHVVDNFDERWAVETLNSAAEVFDLVWLAVLSRFPRWIPRLKAPPTFENSPRARALLDGNASR